jgi:hypothetical protein
MEAGHIKLQVMYLNFSRYEKISCFMVLKPLHSLTEMESRCDHNNRSHIVTSVINV